MRSGNRCWRVRCRVPLEVRVTDSSFWRRVLLATVVYAVVVVGVSVVMGDAPLSAGRLIGLVGGALVMGVMLYVRDRHPTSLPVLWIVLGVLGLLIYGAVLVARGVPDALGERVAMVFVVSLPLLLVVMGVRSRWPRRPRR